MANARLTTKKIRDRQRLDSVDRFALREFEDSAAVLERDAGDLLSLHGMVKPKVRGVTIEDMKETIRRLGALSVPPIASPPRSATSRRRNKRGFIEP